MCYAAACALVRARITKAARDTDVEVWLASQVRSWLIIWGILCRTRPVTLRR